MRTYLFLLLVSAFLIGACTSDSPSANSDIITPADIALDATPNDVIGDLFTSDTVEDANVMDASPAETTTPADVDLDTSPPVDGGIDTSQPGDVSSQPGQTAWGAITGDCGSVSAAVSDTSSSILTTTFTFDDPEKFDAASLEGRAKKRYDEPNAGGSSKCTEVMSMQLLMECEGATVNKLETEIMYDVQGKIADYIVDIGDVKTGVSVTRAYKGPVVDVYTLEDATSLLEKKLAGIEEARQNASEADTWDKSLVHIWTLHPEWAETVTEAWDALESELKASTVVLITVEAGSEYIVTDACDD